VEFTGPTVSEWSLSSRITVANMAAEISAEFALFEADQKVIDYVHSRTRETPRDILGVGGQHVFGNIMLLVINLPLIGIWVQILRVPPRILLPHILFFCIVGAYAINTSFFDVGIMML
jgi:hypothetical protein